jgi:hypothetical protein
MKKKYILISTTILLLTTIACQISFAGNDGPSEEEINLEITRTFLQQTQTALAQPPTPQPEQSPEADDDDQPAPDDDQDDADEDSCYFSRWTGDETILDGTIMDPGEEFVKSWTLRNAGTCDWSTDTRIVFEEGDLLGAPTSVKIDRVVKPGETYVVEIPMQAPASDGNYTGVWRFTAADGTKMGKYWVKITVGNPPPEFAVTSVTYYMPHTTIDMGCPNDISISAEITTNAAGNVSFKWDDSQGCPGCVTKSTTFASAESKIIQHTMTINASGDYWAKIYIDEPNHQWFGQKNFTVNCTP